MITHEGEVTERLSLNAAWMVPSATDILPDPCVKGKIFSQCSLARSFFSRVRTRFPLPWTCRSGPPDAVRFRFFINTGEDPQASRDRNDKNTKKNVMSGVPCPKIRAPGWSLPVYKGPGLQSLLLLPRQMQRQTIRDNRAGREQAMGRRGGHREVREV
jgi:hypothetical protein